MKKKQIVIVEDNADLRELIGILLTNDSYDLNMFETAFGFTTHMTHQKPDVIVLDIMLPDGDGIELCRNMKENVTTKDIPVILMSANRPANDISIADGFIAKPFDVTHFKKVVEQYVQ